MSLFRWQSRPQRKEIPAKFNLFFISRENRIPKQAIHSKPAAKDSAVPALDREKHIQPPSVQLAVSEQSPHFWLTGCQDVHLTHNEGLEVVLEDCRFVMSFNGIGSPANSQITVLSL